MSRKLTTNWNLIFRNDGDFFKNGGITPYTFTEWKVTEATNQSELETTDSHWRKYDEVMWEKYTIIQDLKSQIKQLDIENSDLQLQIVKIIDYKLAEASLHTSMPSINKDLNSQPKHRGKARENKIHWIDSYVTKIDLR